MLRLARVAIAGSIGAGALMTGCFSSADTEAGSELRPAPTPSTSTGPERPGAENSPDYVLPERYSVTVTSSCGERNDLGSSRVTVENGEVVEIRYDDRARFSVPPMEAAPSLEGMQEIAHQAESDGADSVKVEYAPSGRLTGVDIDCLENAVDDELCYATSNFEPVVGRQHAPSHQSG